MIGQCAFCDCNRICAKKGVSCVPVDKDEILAEYTEEEKKIMKAAAYVEATYYMKYTRIQETAAFAHEMGYKKLGLAFCNGLREELALIARYFVQEGFEVESICCKNCAIPKRELGLTQNNPDNPKESMCNPKNQALYLNSKGCEMFVSAGLCVGHDTIFNKNCNGPVTTLVVKDRVLAHNPLGAIYSGYWKTVLGIRD